MQTAVFSAAQKFGHRMEAAAGGMSGGKRNHEDLSDMMALVEAACKVPASTARPFACR